MVPSRAVHCPVSLPAKLAQPMPQVGLQLTVSGLDHDHPQAAVSHIQRLIHQHSLEHLDNPLPPFVFTSPESGTPVDYVYIALSPTGTSQPRADLLERIRQTLSGFSGVRAYWKVNNGQDVSRKVYFQAKSEADARSLKHFCDQYLSVLDIETQGVCITNLHRVVYDVVAHDSVHWLSENSITFGDRTIHAEQRSFIEPVYGFEVAIAGLKEIHNAVDILHHYFINKYGDVIDDERIMLDHDVYCVVFKSWDTTSHVLQDPFTAFSSSSATFARLFPVSKPLLLYVLNTVGVPTSPAQVTPSTQVLSSELEESTEVTALREAIQELDQKVTDVKSSNASLDNTYNTLVKLNVQSTEIARSLTFLCWSNFISDYRTTVDSNINNLRNEQVLDEHRLSYATDSHQRAQLRAQMKERMKAIDRQKRLREEVVEDPTRFELLRGPVASSLQNFSDVLRSLCPKTQSASGTSPTETETESSVGNRYTDLNAG